MPRAFRFTCQAGPRSAEMLPIALDLPLPMERARLVREGRSRPLGCQRDPKVSNRLWFVLDRIERNQRASFRLESIERAWPARMEAVPSPFGWKLRCGEQTLLTARVAPMGPVVVEWTLPGETRPAWRMLARNFVPSDVETDTGRPSATTLSSPRIHRTLHQPVAICQGPLFASLTFLLDCHDDLGRLLWREEHELRGFEWRDGWLVDVICRWGAVAGPIQLDSGVDAIGPLLCPALEWTPIGTPVAGEPSIQLVPGWENAELMGQRGQILIAGNEPSLVILASENTAWSYLSNGRVLAHRAHTTRNATPRTVPIGGSLEVTYRLLASPRGQTFTTASQRLLDWLAPPTICWLAAC